MQIVFTCNLLLLFAMLVYAAASKLIPKSRLVSTITVNVIMKGKVREI